MNLEKDTKDKVKWYESVYASWLFLILCLILSAILIFLILFEKFNCAKTIIILVDIVFLVSIFYNIIINWKILFKTEKVTLDNYLPYKIPSAMCIILIIPVASGYVYSLMQVMFIPNDISYLLILSCIYMLISMVVFEFIREQIIPILSYKSHNIKIFYSIYIVFNVVIVVFFTSISNICHTVGNDIWKYVYYILETRSEVVYGSFLVSLFFLSYFLIIRSKISITVNRLVFSASLFFFLATFFTKLSGYDFGIENKIYYMIFYLILSYITLSLSLVSLILLAPFVIKKISNNNNSEQAFSEYIKIDKLKLLSKQNFYLFSKVNSDTFNNNSEYIPIFLDADKYIECNYEKKDSAESKENDVLLIPKIYFDENEHIKIDIYDSKQVHHYEYELSYTETFYMKLKHYSTSKKKESKKYFLKMNYKIEKIDYVQRDVEKTIYNNLIIRENDCKVEGSITHIDNDFGEGKTNLIKNLSDYSNGRSLLVNVYINYKRKEQSLIELAYFSLLKSNNETKLRHGVYLSVVISCILLFSFLIDSNDFSIYFLVAVMLVSTILWISYGLTDFFIAKLFSDVTIKNKYFEYKIKRMSRKKTLYFIFEEMDREINKETISSLITELHEWNRTFHLDTNTNQNKLYTILNYSTDNIKSIFKDSEQQSKSIIDGLEKIKDDTIISGDRIKDELNDYSYELFETKKMNIKGTSLRDIKKYYLEKAKENNE